ncbi:hypothetical protein [Streptacidiphilus jiangxiensis]|uniref:hypothetical protein n=1 Tax=Streptacidiphilus jiangxiensis TaxID=235985 RepID=UPI0011609D1E|nr:hypothetical protein [Streptacidiphilus jiangxiensis]
MSLIVAIVGVLGTLGSSVWTQRLGQQTKAREMAHEAERATIQHSREQEARQYNELRITCSNLNVRAREYRDALNELFFALRDRSVTAEIREEVARSRREYRTTRGEAQMIIGDAVLDASSIVNRELGRAYGILMRMDRSQPPRRDDSLDEAERILQSVMVATNVMRQQMRNELGVSASAGPPRRPTTDPAVAERGKAGRFGSTST